MSRMISWSTAIVALICCAGVQAASSSQPASPPKVKPAAAPAESGAQARRSQSRVDAARFGTPYCPGIPTEPITRPSDGSS
jgi:hypothetical protein